MTKKFLTVLLITLTALYGCISSNENESPVTYRIISYEEAQQMLENNPSVIVLDVRTEPEHLARNMPGSLLLPVNELNEETAARHLPDKDSVILVHCRTGVRSSNAVEILRNMGYINVYDMDGIESWD